jgi:hypothetical protein
MLTCTPGIGLAPFMLRQRERYITFLQRIPILQTLSHEELLTVADALQSVRCICVCDAVFPSLSLLSPLPLLSLSLSLSLSSLSHSCMRIPPPSPKHTPHAPPPPCRAPASPPPPPHYNCQGCRSNSARYAPRSLPPLSAVFVVLLPAGGVPRRTRGGARGRHLCRPLLHCRGGIVGGVACCAAPKWGRLRF